MGRSGKERLDAIPSAIERGDEFRLRLKEAAADAVRCADMMAEAIAMHRNARMLESVGRDGRHTLSMEELTAMHCMDAARLAYLTARGSNEPA